MDTAAAAVAKVLQMGPESYNRAYNVQDMVTTQNELLRLGKEIFPDAEWPIKPANTTDMAKKMDDAFKADPNSRMGMMLQKPVGVFGAEYPSDFGVSDDAELGIEMMDENQVKDLLRRLA
ncbi:MAG: hypothetical protein LQ340_001727 [Diploschistes diacapsis]|nr:MAG: hypothetical protein LQ340_001727 [Diploschistes diacapsis]